MLLAAVRGGDGPQSSSISRSTDTTSLACSRSTASSDRCLTPPRPTAESSSRTCRGPSSRNSIGDRRVGATVHRGEGHRQAFTCVYQEVYRASTGGAEGAHHDDCTGRSTAQRSHHEAAPAFPHRDTRRDRRGL